jgi:hypothetical protein
LGTNWDGVESLLTGLVVGDGCRIDGEIVHVPDGKAVTRAWLTVKSDPTMTDGSAVFQKIITQTDQEGTGCITNTPCHAYLRFDIIGANTDNLVPGVQYYYDVQIVVDNGSPITLEVGEFRPVQGVTSATS